MAPLTAGTNPLTQAEDAIVNTLANLAAFQSWTGTVDETGAKARVHVGEWDDFAPGATNADFLSKLPLVLVSEGEDAPAWMLKLNDSPYGFLSDFTFALRFIVKTPDGFFKNRENDLREFRNDVGDIFAEWAGLTNYDNKFLFTRWDNDPVQHSVEGQLLPFITWMWQLTREAEVG